MVAAAIIGGGIIAEKALAHRIAGAINLVHHPGNLRLGGSP
jgi:hypothetical protein